MLKVSRRSRWRRCVWRWRLTLTSRSLVRLIASPIIRPVQLNLLFTWAAAHTGTAGLAFQVGPTAHKAGGTGTEGAPVPTCNLPFVAAGALGENFQDQERAVVHRQAEFTFQIALLRRAERLVKQHLGGAVEQRQLLDLVGLAAADKQRRVGRAPFAGDFPHRGHASGLRQQAEFFKLFVEMGLPQIDTDQNGLGREGVRHSRSGCGFGCGVGRGLRCGCGQVAAASVSSTAWKLTARPGTMVEMACL